MAWIAMASAALFAQQTGAELNRTAQDTAQRLGAARADARTEALRSAVEKGNDYGQLDSAAAASKQLSAQPQPYAERAMTEAANARLDGALRDVSPQGKAILAQNSATPALRAPQVERLTSPDSPAAAQAQPQPKANAKGNAKDAPPADTKIVITAQGAAYFDSKQSMAIFTDDVIVVHPQFTMNSDELEVYMNKEKPEAEKKPDDKKPAENAAPAVQAGRLAPEKAAPEAPAAAPTESKDDSGGIDKAIGKGRKVVIQKADENGEPQIGICRHCTYDGKTGDVTLRDYPQVQRGNNVIIATAPTTYMILKSSGELKTFGPNKVDIIQEAKKAPAPATAAKPENPNAPVKPAPVKPKGGQQ